MSELLPKDKSILAFQKWCASMTDEAFTQIVFRGQLNRTEIAKGCGIAKSALRQNPEVKRLLAELEENLRQRQILPALTKLAEEAADMPKFHDKISKRATKDAKRLAELEAEVIALKAKLKRFEELSSVLINFGDNA